MSFCAQISKVALIGRRKQEWAGDEDEGQYKEQYKVNVFLLDEDFANPGPVHPEMRNHEGGQDEAADIV